MRFSLSSRASVASRASPSPGLAHGVKTSVVLSSEARRCLLRALSGFCSVVLKGMAQYKRTKFRTRAHVM